MKTRNGFVSNSSSTSFVIVNKTDKELPFIEFVKENKWLVERYLTSYGEEATVDGLFDEMCRDAGDEVPLQPGYNSYTFGDEDGTTLGRVYDYALRDNETSSKRFSWRWTSCRGGERSDYEDSVLATKLTDVLPTALVVIEAALDEPADEKTREKTREYARAEIKRLKEIIGL